MAGGRGRGMAAFTFRVESLGITRGNMPDARRGPNPLFPIMEYKPVPLEPSHGDDYMLALKQEIRGTMRQLPCFLKANAAKSEVERYNDKYAKETQKIEDGEWTPDWNCLPKELMPRKNVPKKKSVKKKAKVLTSQEKDGMLSRLSELEKIDNMNADEEKEEKEEKKKGEDDEGEEGEELEDEFDEEEHEEDNDYNANYFDDGDDFGAGSDDNMDGDATY